VKPGEIAYLDEIGPYPGDVCVHGTPLSSPCGACEVAEDVRVFAEALSIACGGADVPRNVAKSIWKNYSKRMGATWLAVPRSMGPEAARQVAIDSTASPVKQSMFRDAIMRNAPQARPLFSPSDRQRFFLDEARDIRLKQQRGELTALTIANLERSNESFWRTPLVSAPGSFIVPLDTPKRSSEPKPPAVAVNQRRGYFDE
jgi:hypothetical protein